MGMGTLLSRRLPMSCPPGCFPELPPPLAAFGELGCWVRSPASCRPTGLRPRGPLVGGPGLVRDRGGSRVVP